MIVRRFEVTVISPTLPKLTVYVAAETSTQALINALKLNGEYNDATTVTVRRSP